MVWIVLSLPDSSMLIDIAQFWVSILLAAYGAGLLLGSRTFPLLK